MLAKRQVHGSMNTDRACPDEKDYDRGIRKKQETECLLNVLQRGVNRRSGQAGKREKRAENEITTCIFYAGRYACPAVAFCEK